MKKKFMGLVMLGMVAVFAGSVLSGEVGAASENDARTDESWGDRLRRRRDERRAARVGIVTQVVAARTLDCVPGTCPELVIQGDRAAVLADGRPSPFRGFADPSMRRDPVTGRLWISYSWPNIHELGRGRKVPGVDIHLASSDDDGATWMYHGPLWKSEASVNLGGDGEKGFTDYEVSNLLPRQTANGVTWYGARLGYFLPEDGGFRKRPNNSFRLQIAEASSPADLAGATMATLGGSLTAAEWGVDVDLSSLSRDFSRRQFWNEPALYFEGDTLYLVVRSLSLSLTGPDLKKSDIVVFATRPEGPVKSWQWQYIGKLAGAAEAKELGGEGLTQIEIARGFDGKLLALVTPDRWSDKDFVHDGCRVLEIESMNPPRLARDADGRLKVRASITASDQTPLGPGAFGYDPASSTGIIMVRREKGDGSMTASMHRTGLHP